MLDCLKTLTYGLLRLVIRKDLAKGSVSLTRSFIGYTYISTRSSNIARKIFMYCIIVNLQIFARKIIRICKSRM